MPGATALSRPWLAGALGLGLSIWLLQPGFMSWDSAEQWRQARLGQYDDVFPPLMAMLWRQVDRLVEGPLGMFLLQALLYWFALAGICSRLPWPESARASLVLLLGLWPPLFGLLGHIWKDVWVMALFALAVGALRVEQEWPAARWRAAALLALLLACAFRHNAITGAVPLLALWAWRTLRAGGLHPGRAAWRVAGLTVASCILVHLGSGLPARHPSVRRVSAIWSAVALWDMAAVSIREGRLAFPPGFAEPALTLDELQGYFRDYSNTTIFQTGHLRLSFHRPYEPADAERLFAAWLRLPRDHGPAWVQHRLRLCALLFGWDRPGLPDFQVFQFVRHELEGNPPLHARPSAAQRYVVGGLLSLADTPLFAGWMYLLLALATALWAGFRRGRPEAALGGAVALSALSYALPLALASGSAEFRYLAWPVLAALLAPLLLARPEPGAPAAQTGPR